MIGLRSLRQIGIVLALFCAAALLPTVAAGQAPTREDAFVYALTAFDGRVYHSTFAPPNANTIYFLQGSDNVISPRQTRVYFWNLSNRYEPDWTAKNEFAEGVLEVRKRGQMVAALEPVSYVIQVDESQPNAEGQLFVGAAADVAYANFQQRQDAYRTAIFEYAKAYQRFTDEVNALIAAKGVGNITPEEFPRRPDPVPRFALLSGELSRGYVVNLPAGNYDLQVRLADGSILPDSERGLEVFGAQGEGVSYTAMPGERWTKPEISRMEGSALFVPDGGRLYLQPFRQIQYNDHQYGRLLDPQDESGRRDQLRWVSYRPITDATLKVQARSEAETIPLRDFKVVQLASSGLGYEVRALEAGSGETASFSGFALELGPGDRLALHLVDGDGLPMAGSAREVRSLRTSAVWTLYLLALTPLVIGGVAVWRRGRKARRLHIFDENEPSPKKA